MNTGKSAGRPEETFEVGASAIEGRGIFAVRTIRKGEIICVFRGEIITIPELKQRYATGEERIDDPLQIANDLYMDLEEPYGFFNHSCDPNAGMRGKGVLFALREIARGEEITFDYSTTEWTDDEAWGMPWRELWNIPCTCGAERCRKEIRVFPALPVRLQKRYYASGALPDFMRDKYERETLS